MQEKLTGKIIILSTVLFLLLGIGISIYKWAISNSAGAKVIITDKGFIPDHVRIPRGTAVTWVNEGERPHWPASDIHPAHKQYPSNGNGCIGSNFDSCLGLANGEAYFFIFDKAGTWGVHDHLYPGLTMNVEVVEDSLLAKIALLNIFYKKKDLSPPSSETFLALEYTDQRRIVKGIISENPRKAWDYLKSIYIRDGQTIAADASGLDHWHVFAHLVGHEFYKQYGVLASSLCSDKFTYGCMHGVYEKMLLKRGLDAIREIEQGCFRIDSDEVECAQSVHGLGHGLLAWENFDAEKAIEDCDKLKDKSMRPSCYRGLFMEYAWSAPKDRLLLDDPLKFCVSFSGAARLECAVFQTPILLRANNWGLADAAEACFDSKDAIFTRECMFGFAVITAHMAMNAPDKILEQCALIKNKEFEHFCVIMAAGEIKYQQYFGWRETVPYLCSQLPDDMIEQCFETTGQVTLKN